jgi:hypothetical protein
MSSTLSIPLSDRIKAFRAEIQRLSDESREFKRLVKRGWRQLVEEERRNQRLQEIKDELQLLIKGR